MKKLLLYIAGLCSIAACTVSPPSGSAKPVAKTLSGFVADSGYITVQNLHTTLVISQRDTLFKIHEDWKPADTIGKYYKMQNGNYIASVAVTDSNDYDVNVICEAEPGGTILKQEIYNLGMYRCGCGVEEPLRRI